MVSDGKGLALVIMGVSGAGKSTIGDMLAKSLNCNFLDADDFHPQSNRAEHNYCNIFHCSAYLNLALAVYVEKKKMQKGIALSDEDRIPWLNTLREALKTTLMSGKNIILGCSALQKRYREILRSADPNYELGNCFCTVKFVLLDVGADVLAIRLEKRAAETKHFMPATLLQSQLDLLQIEESEGIIKVDATLQPLDIVNIIRSLIFPLNGSQI